MEDNSEAPKKTTIKNIKDLTEHLVMNYEKLSDGELIEKRAKEISNMAGKIIGSVKVNLEYNKFLKLKRKINFLDTK